MSLFNINDWESAVKKYDWYLRVPKFLDDLSNLKNSSPEEYEEEKSRILNFFIESLANNKVSLGESGEDWDRQRKPIDTIVIHHTGSESRMSDEKLSALELIMLYAPVYTKPNNKEDKNISERPVYSNHFRDNKMVFWPYHWIIRKDGTVERLLEDNEIGWHAGDWDINCRSIAIAMDNDYENGSPSESEIMSIASIIVNNYPSIASKSILGHCEVNTKTICPSNNFLGINGWKKDLLKVVEEMKR